MLSCPTVEKRAIRGHYDLSTPFYRLLWGPHLHHGLWYSAESPRQAQVNLTEHLATLAGIQGGQLVLDVGCGMGGSSIHMVRTRGCRAIGITISRMQRHWAALAARWHGVPRQAVFRCADAEEIDFPPTSFDVVWSIECTEHLFEKPRFFERAAAWLKPGGTLAICAWLAGDSLDDAGQSQCVYDVCEGFLCPSLGTMADYTAWMQAAGLSVARAEDWTDQVTATWEICRRRVARTKIRWLAQLINRREALFLDRFDAILEAYRSGAMKYGCFIGYKPTNSDA